jgi:hypothetical protein
VEAGAQGAGRIRIDTTTGQVNFDNYEGAWGDQAQLDRSTMGNPPSFVNFATDPKFTADQDKARAGLSPGPTAW